MSEDKEINAKVDETGNTKEPTLKDVTEAWTLMINNGGICPYCSGRVADHNFVPTVKEHLYVCEKYQVE